MLVKREYNFDIRKDCWGGAKERIESLTDDLVDKLKSYLDDPEIWGEDTPTEQEVNNFIWFGDDNYAEWLGFNSAEQLWDYCTLVNNGTDEEDIWFDEDDNVVSIDDISERFDDAINDGYIDENDYEDMYSWAEDNGYYQIEI